MPATAKFRKKQESNGRGSLDTYYSPEGGLTKREYVAAMAMQGLLSSVGENEYYECHSDCAKAAVSYADALLKQLEESE